jgi:uncharacterized protein (TIGR00299 family) protein
MSEKIAFINCSAGVAGDMLIAACIDAGVNKTELERRLRRGLKIAGWEIEVREIQRGHAKAKSITVLGDRPFDSAAQMLAVLKKSAFPKTVKETGVAILESIIAAEARVHGVRRQEVHFHELNSIDTLVDIMGVCTALELLGIDRVCATPINLGCAAPATLEIVKAKGVPVFSQDAVHELATPTGTAIIAGISRSFEGMPLMQAECTGRGAGTREIPGNAGVLQIIAGTSPRGVLPYRTDETILLETNIDDMDPRVYPYVSEQLFAVPVKDVWFTQILMKKGRPGVMISVLCAAEQEAAAVQILFAETTTLGLRRTVCPRYILQRKEQRGQKLAYLPEGKSKVSEEYEIAKHRALHAGSPLKDFL